MTRVRGKQQRDRNKKRRSFDSAGSRTSKLVRHQFMQTLQALEPAAGLNGRVGSSLDKLNISKSREQLRYRRKLLSNYEEENED